jgi:hypothetical protein
MADLKNSSPKSNLIIGADRGRVRKKITAAVIPVFFFYTVIKIQD